MYRCLYFRKEGGGQAGCQNVFIFYVLIMGGGGQGKYLNQMSLNILFLEGYPKIFLEQNFLTDFSLCRIADARYGSWDRLYYNSLFSVIFLTPASLYLEEAFEALNFHHDRQGLFLAGCFVSAVLGKQKYDQIIEVHCLLLQGRVKKKIWNFPDLVGGWV